MKWPLGEENTMILTGWTRKRQFYLLPLRPLPKQLAALRTFLAHRFHRIFQNGIDCPP
jgi:hypothetical protein